MRNTSTYLKKTKGRCSQPVLPDGSEPAGQSPDLHQESSNLQYSMSQTDRKYTRKIWQRQSMDEAKRLMANSGRNLARLGGAGEIRLLTQCRSQHLTSSVMNGIAEKKEARWSKPVVAQRSQKKLIAH